MIIMENTMKRFSIIALATATLAAGLHGQAGRGGGGGWSTSRADAQRTGWVRTDSLISVESLQKPGFGLEWTVKAGHSPREVLSEGVSGNTTQLDPAPGNVAGSGNNLYGYEVDTGYLTWTKHFDVAGTAPAPTAACPGGMTAGVTRPTMLTQTVTGAGPGRAGGAGGVGYTGGVGQPGEGVPAAFFVRAGRGGGRGGSGLGGLAGAGAGGGSGRGVIAGGGGGAAGASGGRVGLRGEAANAYVISSDGVLHTIGQQQGKETAQPVPFLPANANATGTILVDQILYATTINGCGGVPNGVWSIGIGLPKPYPPFKTGASPVGEIAFSSNGTLFVAIGDGTAGADGYSDAIVALDPQHLTVRDWFTLPGASFATGPVIFDHAGHELVAAATKDGRVFLLDASKPGGADHKTALAVSAATTTSKTWSPSALATWEDGAQNRWLLVPSVASKGGITAFKVAGDAAKPTLQRAWTSSSDMSSPSAPVVVNGVVFALNNGSATSPAVLYALDGLTGKELWNSGRTITSFVRSAGMWAMNGGVHVATSDATVYGFGFAADRHPVR